MKFITLTTGAKSEVVHVNFDLIESFNAEGNGSRLVTPNSGSEGSYLVNETPFEICELLKRP